MANSDKNILITPNVGADTGSQPTIAFTGANNTPITLRTLDTGTVSFEATAGQLFSIADGLSGTIFSVNDISGIPSIEVLSTGLIKLNEYNGQTVIGGASAAGTAELTIYPSLNTSLGLVIKGLASQSGNLQEWQDSTGTALTSIGPTGNIISQSILATGVFRLNDANSLSATAHIVNTSGANIGLLVKGDSAQSANLQEWQNSSGTVLANISSTGGFSIPSLVVSGDLTVNGTTTFINTQSLSIDDKNIELGAVPSGTISTTGTVGSISGSGPWTATITGMTTSVGLIPGSAIAATNGTGSLGGGGGTYIVTSIVSATSVTFSATGGTTPTAGTVTNITTTGATNLTADGGGITLKGATDKTFNWVNSTGAWTSSEDMNLVTGKVYEINGTSVLSATTLGSGVTASSLTSVGTIGTGTWQGTAIAGQYGGTGVANTGKTITVSGNTTIGSSTHTVAFATSGNTSVTLPTSGTLITTANNLGAFAATTSAELAGVISDETGSGVLVFGTSPTLTTPTINTINISSSSTAAALWNTTLTTGSISMGATLTTGSINIGNGTAISTGTINIASGASTGNKNINIGTTGASGSTTSVNIGSSVSGSVSNIVLNGFLGIGGTASGSKVQIYNDTAANIGLIVRGAAAQTANLQEWQNSALAVRARVDSGGAIYSLGGLYSNFFASQSAPTTSSYVQFTSNSTRIITQTTNATSFIVIGETAQTADLQRWQNVGGTVLAAVNISGGFELNGKDIELMSIMGAY